jgi:WD40 repeat protein
MKQLFAFLLLTLFLTAQAQTPDCTPKDYERLMAEAKRLAKDGEYDKAINKLQSAKTCQPQREAEVNREVLRVFEQVNGERRSAIRNEQEANKQRVRAEDQTKIAQSEKEKAEAEARRIYANDLAFKSRIALREGDRTTAIRLAEFSLNFVEEDNFNIINTLIQATYWGNNTSHSPFLLSSTFDNYGGYGQKVAISPNDDLVALAIGNVVSIWSRESGKRLKILREHKHLVLGMAFSPDGKSLATGSFDGSVKLWDIERGNTYINLIGHESSVEDVSFSPDGKLLATCSRDNSVIIWNLELKKAVKTLKGHTDYIWDVAFSPDGEKVATASSDRSIKVWDWKKGSVEFDLLKHKNHVRSIAFSPDGKSLVSGSEDATVNLWDLQTGNILLNLEGHTKSVRETVFSPDGTRIASASEDNTVKIWDSKNGQMLYSIKINDIESKGGCKSVAFNSDGKYLVTTLDNGSVKMWDLESLYTDWTLETHSKSADFALFYPDNKRVLLSSYLDTITTVNLESESDRIKLYSAPDFSRMADMSPDGKMLALVTINNEIKLCDIECDSLLLILDTIKVNVRDIKFSSDNNSLIAMAGANMVIKYNLLDRTKKIVFLGDQKQPKADGLVNCTAFSKDQKKISVGGSYSDIVEWDVESGERLHVFKGHTSSIYSVQYSYDDKYLATGSWDNTAKVWDTKTGKLIHTLRGHSDHVISAAFSPDSKFLATGSKDRSIKLWDAKSGSLILTIKAHNNAVDYITFSPNGNRILSISSDNVVKIWEIKSRGLLARAYKMFSNKGYPNPGFSRILSPLTAHQIQLYSLENILDLNPDNEKKLIETQDVLQIVAFAQVFEQKFRESDIPLKSDYDRASRLYQACLDSGLDNPYFQQKIEDLKRVWAEKQR